MEELHKCKYCGVETTQPDDECYAKPAKTMTAVEWFVSQLKAKKWEDWNDIIEQAKEMEKQQIIDAGAFKELAEWLLINKRSVFMDADISKESKKKIINDFGYSSNSLDE